MIVDSLKKPVAVRRWIVFRRWLWLLTFLFSIGFTRPGHGAVVINEVHYEHSDKLRDLEFIELINASGNPVHLGGWTLAGAVRYTFPRGTVVSPGGFVVAAKDPAAMRAAFGIDTLGPYEGRLSNEGERLVLMDDGQRIRDDLEYRPGFPWPTRAAGDGSSMELLNPAADNQIPAFWRSSTGPETAAGTSATPGAINSVHTEFPPPAILEVSHEPKQPTSTQPVRIQVRLLRTGAPVDVELSYQVVEPGSYIPADLPLPHETLVADPDRPFTPNPEFEDPANWRIAVMRDDGNHDDEDANDGIFGATLPPLAHRTLLRYRVTASDRGDRARRIRVPFEDDPSRNFACFIYDGVPPYRPEIRTVHPAGPGAVYGRDAMESIPVYHLITRSSDFVDCQGFDPADRIPKENQEARSRFNWEAAIVYNGIVYDHIHYRLRQANDRYNAGEGDKRALRFRFNNGHYFDAKELNGEPTPRRLRSLNASKMFDNKRVRNFGLTESINSLLWNWVGVPAPRTHYFHLRVIDDTEEHHQYWGDFWGVFLAMEDFDARFLDGHGLPDGNLYKLKDGEYDGDEIKRVQGRDSVADDSDFQNIRKNLGPRQPDDWLIEHVRWDRWYRYHAVNEAIRHYDYHFTDTALKNRAWYFEPSGSNPLGRLWVLPWDSDASWGPNWGIGNDIPKHTIFFFPGKENFKTEYRNFMREFRDLLWRPEIINPVIDALAARIETIADADRDRWLLSPFGPSSPYPPLAEKVLDMKQFAFEGWIGSSGPDVGPGGRAAYLDELAAAEDEDTKIPHRPQVTYIGGDGFPMDHLAFRSSPFSDPQGNHTFGAYHWRIAEFSPDWTVNADLLAPPQEWDTVWETRDGFGSSRSIRVGRDRVRAGRTYRIRARFEDQTGRCSHWSDPVTFTPRPVTDVAAIRNSLRITEIAYHPPDWPDLEYIEFANIGDGRLDLRDVYFDDGVEFHFKDAQPNLIDPGKRFVLVKDTEVFRMFYPDPEIVVAGVFGKNLSNRGERLGLAVSGEGSLLELVFDDDWHKTTDGGGAALELVDPVADIHEWNRARAWKPSAVWNGTPGFTLESHDGDGDGDELPDDWETRHGLDPRDPRDRWADVDGDWHTATEEFVAGTSPRIGDDVFKFHIRLDGGRVRIRVAGEPVGQYGFLRFYDVEQNTGNGRWTSLGVKVQENADPVEWEQSITPTRLREMVTFRGSVWIHKY